MAFQVTTQTLGQLLRQAREIHGLSLRQMAGRLQRQDGQPITPKYLHLLEQDCRRPSLHLTQQLATILALDEAFLVAQAHQTAALLRRYLQEQPEREHAFAEMMLQAEHHGFVAWERLTRQIVASQGSSLVRARARDRGRRTRRSHHAPNS
jgi:transcriptional regulator with XRE-family HTH domain